MKIPYFLFAAAALIATWLALSGDKVVEKIAAPRDTAHRIVVSQSLVSEHRSASDILALRQREELIGGAHAENRADNLFRSQSWLPQPVAASLVATAPPPIPTAPPLTYAYLGKKMEDGNWEVYLARGEQTFIVREQATLDYNYRVDSIQPPIMTLTYLPLKQQQTFSIGSIE